MQKRENKTVLVGHFTTEAHLGALASVALTSIMDRLAKPGEATEEDMLLIVACARFVNTVRFEHSEVWAVLSPVISQWPQYLLVLDAMLIDDQRMGVC